MTSPIKDRSRPTRSAVEARGGLERQYGSIGIPAVAAAARYNDDRRPAPTAKTAEPHWLHDDAIA